MSHKVNFLWVNMSLLRSNSLKFQPLFSFVMLPLWNRILHICFCRNGDPDVKWTSSVTKWKNFRNLPAVPHNSTTKDSSARHLKRIRFGRTGLRMFLYVFISRCCQQTIKLIVFLREYICKRKSSSLVELGDYVTCVIYSANYYTWRRFLYHRQPLIYATD